MLRHLFLAERDPFIRQRLQFLWRVRVGDSLTTAAEQVGVSDRTGRRWIQTYRRSGLSGLGRPRIHGGGSGSKLTTEQWEAVRTHLITGNCRTALQVMRWMRETFGVQYKRDSLYKALQRHRIRLKVPRPRSDKTRGKNYGGKIALNSSSSIPRR